MENCADRFLVLLIMLNNHLLQVMNDLITEFWEMLFGSFQSLREFCNCDLSVLLQ
jgi:hypothetical protein